LSGKKLSTVEHDRGSAALRHVYPVVSRRAGGVSVGINLNPNNACNWRCIYCQVPDLTRGSAPPVDLAVLENELRSFLDELLHGELPGPQGTGPWTTTALAFLGVVDAFLEPDPDFVVPPEALPAG